MGDITGLLYEGDIWWISGVLLTIGTLTAVFSMLTGLLEITKIDENTPAMKIVDLHMKLTIITWCLYATSLFMRMDAGNLAKPGLLETGLSLTGFAFLCAAGWFGATLVYTYKVGVKR